MTEIDEGSMVPRISVITPTHNGASGIGETIASLAQQDLARDEYEVIVVDNASTDNTRAVVEEAARNHGMEVRYVYEPRLGLHYVRHVGARVARGPVLAFTDDDVTSDQSWLRELLTCYEDEGVGCVGGKSLPRWEVPPPEWIMRYRGPLALLDLGSEVRELEWPKDIYGCNFSIRRDLLFALGGFNPDSFGAIWLGDGETGLLRKVYRDGWKVVYNPQALVWHRIPRARLTLDYMKRRFANQGAADAYTRYHNRPYGKSHLVGHGLGFAALAIAYKTLGLMGRAGWGSTRYHRDLRASYCWSRARYPLRLLHDRELQALVAREDWINETPDTAQ